MVRTQIYLSDEQRSALKALAYVNDQNVSDIVRRAVDRLRSDEFNGKEWATEMVAVVDRAHAAGRELSDDEVDVAIEARRERKRKQAAVLA